MHLGARVDGGPEIGYGHLFRTLALVEAFLDGGHDVTVATRTPDSAATVFPPEVRVEPLSGGGTWTAFYSWLEGSGPDTVVLDTYDADSEIQGRVSERTRVTTVVDDHASRTVDADVVVNGNLYASALEYRWTGAEPTWCLGPDYLLLKAAVRTLANEDPPWREPPESAVVTMGGSDPAYATADAVRAFEGTDLDVEVIVGPGFAPRNVDAIRGAIDATDVSARSIHDPSDLPRRLFEADLAVSASGTTTYELLALGTPFVAVPQAENQRPVADALRERDAATVLDGDATVSAIREGVEEYVDDAGLRERRRRLGRSIVDARGSNRVYRTILDELEAGSDP